MRNAWRVPLSLITMSSMIFLAVTFGFGFSINRMTGDFEINAEQTWGQYDPMEIVWGEFWRYYCLAGFYSVLAVFTWCWFDWMKTRRLT